MLSRLASSDDTDVLELDTQSANSTEIEQSSNTTLATRGEKHREGDPYTGERCCKLTNTCYGSLYSHLDKPFLPSDGFMYKKEGKIWKAATCCLTLWEESCPGDKKKYPSAFRKPARCSNPQYPDLLADHVHVASFQP